MKEINFQTRIAGIKDYRMFLMDLDRKFKSVGVLYREFKLLEELASTALKVSPSLHEFVSKQQSVVYGKLEIEVISLSETIKQGKVCFIKNEDLNQ